MSKIEIISPETYAIERAICDTAARYFDKHCKGNSLSAELAAHPDYAACNNDMRGRVEQYELLTNTPEKFVAYIGIREPNGMGVEREIGRSYPVIVWTGLQIGNCTLVEHKSRGRWKFDRVYQCYANINGREFTGRTQGVGMYVSLRETAASKRKRAA